MNKRNFEMNTAKPERKKNLYIIADYRIYPIM